MSKFLNQVPVDKNNLPVASPCVSICALNEEDICIGCYRSGDEISCWGDMSDADKRKVLALVAERRKKFTLF